MKSVPLWLSRAWLPYTLVGIAWFMVGSLVLNNVGLIFIGLQCLSMGLLGAVSRRQQGHSLIRDYRQVRR